MSISHTRSLPVAPERVEHLSQLIYDRPFDKLHTLNKVKVLNLTLHGELVEAQKNTNFYLFEAYEIYNARFR